MVNFGKKPLYFVSESSQSFDCPSIGRTVTNPLADFPLYAASRKIQIQWPAHDARAVFFCDSQGRAPREKPGKD